jgi:hypothetical protein
MLTEQKKVQDIQAQLISSHKFLKTLDRRNWYFIGIYICSHKTKFHLYKIVVVPEDFYLISNFLPVSLICSSSSLMVENLTPANITVFTQNNLNDNLQKFGRCFVEQLIAFMSFVMIMMDS